MKFSENFINRFFLVYTILFPAFSILLGALDKAGRLPLILVVVGMLLSLRNREFGGIFTSRPVVFWWLWALYSFVNWLIIGISPDSMPAWTFVARHFVYPLMTMVFVYYEGSKNLGLTTKILIIAYSIYLFMGLTMQSAGSGSGTGWDARGGAELGNSLPLNACVLAFLSCFAYMRKQLRFKILAGLIILCTAAILFTATRKAFAALGIIIIFLVMAKIGIRKPSDIFKFAFIMLALYIGVDYILSNTLMGDRMATIGEQSERYDIGNSLFLQFVGDRAIQYMLSWDIFLEHPLTGIGIKNFATYSDFPYPLHTEYMVQLAEGGLMGTLLYFGFISGLIKLCILTIRRKSYELGLVCLSGIAYILFINFTSWTFESTRYWVVYGIILACCKPLPVAK